MKYRNKDGQTVDVNGPQGLWEYAERRFGEGLWLGFDSKPYGQYSRGASVVITRNCEHLDRLTPIDEGGAK
tara:strand:- start:79 stop:291 length:213 start_codon:yes stop_codon:yes gene_type:complete